MKVKVLSIFAFPGCLFVIDTKRRLWERDAKWELGRWGLVELPEDPETGRKSRKRGGRR